MRRSAVLSALTATTLLTLGAAHAAAPKPTLGFRVFADTGHHMNTILWAGNQFLYVENTTNTIWAAPAAGVPLHQFATMPELVEETRCVQSPGTHGYPAGLIYCHSPDDKIYAISADGTSVTVFATLPVPAGSVSDGALAWDDVGHFGFQLVAATGRTGPGENSGGDVFTVSAAGQVAHVGSYTGPGADEVAIAPATFGSVGGQALLTLDAGPDIGGLAAMDATGKTRTVVSLPAGLNPICAITAPSGSKGGPAAGLYVTNDINPYVYFAPAAQLAAYVGDLIVGSEDHAHFWIVEPRASGFVEIPVRHSLRGGKYALEGCVFVS
jgi:hypothetical protein